MGKKAKKKARTPLKENRPATLSKKVSEHLSEGDAIAVKEKHSCVHFEKGLKLDKVLDKIKSSQQIKCQECREGVHEKRGTKSKGKRGISSSEPKSENKAIWVCLECGHYVCGGVGLPTESHSHVVRHIRLTRHRLVIQWQNPHLRWCFPCHSLLPVEKEENGEKKDVLLEVVKLIKEQSSKTSVATDDTEELCSGSGSVISAIKLEGSAANGIEARDGYVVRGLVNLGNTCFFNSIMQNLLSLDQLRDHFLKEDVSSGGGPLFSSLKKLFAETKPEAGVKSVINPRSFFGSFCSKAPQFRGYDQHDSHELLRCLLDGLSTEESAWRKKCDVDNNVSSTLKKPTLIDSVFGGETSSIVSCMECGHSSKVYEPFLDLSLPIPFKKTPPKKPQAISRAKKAKLPPKKGSKNSSKVSKGTKITPTKALSSGKDLVATEGSGTSSSTAPIDNGQVLETSSVIAQTSESATQSEAEFDSFWLDIIGPATSENETNLEMQDNVCYNFPTTEANGSVQGPDIPTSTSVSSGDQTSDNNYERLIHDNDGCKMQDNVSNGSVPGPDFPATSVTSGDRTSEDNYERRIHDNGGFAKAETIQDKRGAHATQSNVSDISTEINHASCNGGYHVLGESSSSVNPWDDDDEELPLMVADSQVLYMPYKEDISYDDKTVSETIGDCSSSFVGADHHQNADFVDIGGLFAEPEVSSGPVFGPPSKAEVSGVSFTALSSESDPEEIDDSDSPVSVEKCLSHFTKPEILSDDNAWNCENCSKNLKLQRLRQNKKSKDEIRLSNTTNRSDQCENGLKHKTLPKCKENAMSNGISRHTDVSEDSTDTSDVNDVHNSNGKEAMSSYSVNNSESEGSEDEEAVDSKKLIVKRDATKRVLINKTPPVLTIHLKRFSQDHRGRLSKLSGHVSFKELIDLRPYMNSRCTKEYRHMYRLAGLVEHSGTMRGGHYVAYVRGGNMELSSSVWYNVSDAYVRQVSLEKVLHSEAYILFYEQI